MNYVKLNIELNELHPWRDILIYELGEVLFESFEDTENGLHAYVPEKEFNEDNILAIEKKFQEHISKLEVEFIQAQNWNANWEANFDPVLVGKQLMIKAPFHDADDSFDYVIEIQPKMSFGTGHHETTRLISTFLLNETSIPEVVLDMGCGTGVLTILAEKLGAKSLTGIDIEDWAYENSIENAERNDCKNIKFLHGGIEQIPNQDFGLILANINKNILLQQMDTFYNRMIDGAKLILSGFYQSDVQDLVTFGEKLGFTYVKEENIQSWAMLVLKK